MNVIYNLLKTNFLSSYIDQTDLGQKYINKPGFPKMYSVDSQYKTGRKIPIRSGLRNKPTGDVLDAARRPFSLRRRGDGAPGAGADEGGSRRLALRGKDWGGKACLSRKFLLSCGHV